MMIHLNISHLDYAPALSTLREKGGDLSSLDMSIDFAADHSQSKIIRDFVGMIFDAHDIVGPWKGRFILITDELINNAIEHGSQEGDLDTCVLKAGRKSDGTFSITLEVHDTGTGKDSDKAKDMTKIRSYHMENNTDVYMEKRGRGLFRITEKLVDRLEFTESPKGGLAVKIEKSIPQE